MSTAATLPANFLIACEFTLGPSIEGGYVNDPRDPGGETNRGLADMADGKKDGKHNGIVIKGMTLVQAQEAYLKEYWNPTGCGNVPLAVAIALFDTGVNSGPPRAAMLLQEVLGMKVVDGIIGPKTLAAVNAAWSGGKPAKILFIERYCTARLKFCQGLKTWPTYKNGWTARIQMLQEKCKKHIE